MMTSTIKVPPPETRACAAIERAGAREAQPEPSVLRASSEPDLESRIKQRRVELIGTLREIRPLYDRILARRLDEQDRTSGGLFIPDNAKEKPLEAMVIAVGRGKLLANGAIQPIAVKAGDKILIAKYSGSEVKLIGKDHIIVREDDVLGVLEDGSQ